MPTPAWLELVLAVAGFLVAAGTIYRYVLPLLKAAVRLVRGTAELVDDYRRTGGFAGLYKELHPNGGSSLRDVVDLAAREARDAAGDARRAVVEAERVGEITSELRSYAHQNREGIADLREGQHDLSRRLTDVDEKADALGERQTDHRRRNDEQVDALRAYLEGERVELMTAKAGLEASVSELLMVESHQSRQGTPNEDAPDHQPDL